MANIKHACLWHCDVYNICLSVCKLILCLSQPLLCTSVHYLIETQTGFHHIRSVAGGLNFIRPRGWLSILSIPDLIQGTVPFYSVAAVFVQWVQWWCSVFTRIITYTGWDTTQPSFYKVHHSSHSFIPRMIASTTTFSASFHSREAHMKLHFPQMKQIHEVHVVNTF